MTIKSLTPEGAAGFESRFRDGLTVIRAKNSSGKTLLLNSIMYALGLEGALKPGKQGVLTTALTRTVKVQGAERPVRQSWIDLEITNGRKTITVRRYPVPPEGIKSDLITVWDGPLLTESRNEASEPRYYYVGRGGTAQNEGGFHNFLARFLGWDLPVVPTYSGKEIPLYLQVLAALFFVEQKQGWSGIVPKMPTQYQIREPLRRSIEFYLRLDIMERARRRSELQQGLTVLRAEYSALRGALDAAAQVSNARVTNPSEFGSAAFYRTVLFGAESGEVDASQVLTVFHQDQWISLEEMILNLQSRISELEEVQRSRLTETEASALNTLLSGARERLRQITLELQSIDDSANMMYMQRGILEKRRRLLEQEQRRYKDIAALENLGAEYSAHAIGHRDCPTCQQSLDGTESLSGAPVLTTSESAALVGHQLETISNVINDAEVGARANEAARGSLEQEAGEVRARIRAIQADLEAEAPHVSVARLQARIAAETRYQELLRLRDSAQVTVNDLLDVQQRSKLVKQELDGLGEEELTAQDAAKLNTWQRELQRLLSIFGFVVFAPREITVDPQGMRPAHGDSDLGFQGSASDGLKLRWAYLLSLVQVSGRMGGCHPGLLMLDGPRMYDVEPTAMQAFLRSCSELQSDSGRAQIILTLSEERGVVEEWLSGCEYEVVHIPDRLLN
ncbi:ATP-binding protein [Streptomyces malaysiensis]|uniref:ATP-binding protein n=1 Tax=Streptomyces malaysiensis TaxID=92644 RepID=UPI00115F5D0D|nr:ATP-binding protein [Streptomyces malaysiensis]